MNDTLQTAYVHVDFIEKGACAGAVRCPSDAIYLVGCSWKVFAAIREYGDDSNEDA